ncbi:MAG: hypothetical protein ACI9KE_006226, partial [Polyangiales bacterium]
RGNGWSRTKLTFVMVLVTFIHNKIMPLAKLGCKNSFRVGSEA